MKLICVFVSIFYVVFVETNNNNNNYFHEKTIIFRENLFLTLRIISLKLKEGNLTYSLCCPFNVVECRHHTFNNHSIADDNIHNINIDNNINNNIANNIDNRGDPDDDSKHDRFTRSHITRRSFEGQHDDGILNDNMDVTRCTTSQVNRLLSVIRIKLHGKWIGRDKLILNIMNDARVVASQSVDILVLPPKTRFGLMPTIGLFVGFSLNIFGFALTIEFNDVTPFLRKPIELTLIIFCQYFVFPSLAWLINMVLKPPLMFQFMLICTASASAGAFTNLCCVIMRGRLNLNIISLIVTPLVGIVAVPLWVCTLGRKILLKEFHQVEFPWLLFLALKCLFLIPGFLFFLIKLIIPEKSQKLALIIRPIALVWVVCMLIMIAIDAIWTLEYATDWRVAMGPPALFIIGGIVIFAGSFAMTRNSKTSLTITLQGIMTNPSYAILFCLTMVPKPYTGIPICTTILHFISLASIGLITSTIIRIRYHFFNRNLPTNEKEVNQNHECSPRTSDVPIA